MTWLVMSVVASAACFTAEPGIYDASIPIQGYDSATAYLTATKCDNGIHNSFACRVVLIESDDSEVQKTSSTYTNATGKKSSGEAKAKNRDAKSAHYYYKAICYICNSGWGNGTTFKKVKDKYF
jgi:hypothetical protein